MDGLAAEPIVIASAPAETIGERALFYALLSIDEHHDLLATALALATAAFDAAAASAGDPAPLPTSAAALASADWREVARRWRTDHAASVAGRLAQVAPAQAPLLLRQCAPEAVTDGAWSQYVSDAARSHTPVTALLLRPFVARMGAGEPAGHIGNAFLDLLRALGQGVAEPTSWAFVEDAALIDAAFGVPVLRLAVSLFPQRFLPEILGIDLFEAVRGTSPVAAALEPAARGLGAGARWFDLRRALEQAHDPLRCATEAVAQYLASETPEPGRAWARVRAGFAAAREADAAFTLGLLDWASGAAFCPRANMLELVRRKAAAAVGYHGRGRMRGRTLDAWFAEAGRYPGAFVDALAETPWVRPGDSAASRLLGTLIGTRGPMAGIFTKPEVAVIARWIDTLPHAADTAVDAGASPARAHARLPAPAGADRAFADMPVRTLYHHMLHVEFFPAALEHARKFATGWLTRAGRIRPGDPRPPPFESYSHAALQGWLDAQHRRQVATFQAASGAPAVSREALIESSLQLCPTILIDGAWLQRFSSVAAAGTDVGAKLFRIYLDEVGDGDPVENHPNVYRVMMAQMGVDLPEFGTMAFADWHRFQDASFQLPTFWLCVSQFPRQFLPEILGLNLAIELSGVGGTYRTTSHALRHYGYDSLFVDLHNTVDNISTGHTALALEAVKCHLDEMLARGGRAEVQRRWQRVWTGFRALAPG